MTGLVICMRLGPRGAGLRPWTGSNLVRVMFPVGGVVVFVSLGCVDGDGDEEEGDDDCDCDSAFHLANSLRSNPDENVPPIP